MNVHLENKFQPIGLNISPWGYSVAIRLENCNLHIMQDENKIADYLKQLINLLEMKAYGDPRIIRFGEDPKVQGISFFQLIETSAISGHLAEESRTAHIDIFSCKIYNPDDAIKFTSNFFEGVKCYSCALSR